MIKKGYKIAFEQENEIFKVYLDSNSILYMAMAELVLSSDDIKYNDRMLDVMETLNSRSIKRGNGYALLTCISIHGLTTHVVVMCKDSNDVLKELDIVCSLIESVSQGTIKCLSLNNVATVVKHCLGNFSPINFLVYILLKSYKRNNLGFILHPIAINPSYTIHTSREYEYISTSFSHGSIDIGYLYSNPNIVVTLSDEHISRHIAIVGSTGSGKSTTASIIAEKAAKKGYAVVIIDWHGEYENLLQYKESTVYTNPMKEAIPEPLNLEELIKREPLSFIEILESSLELTPPQAHILEDAVNVFAQKFIGNSYCIDVIIDIIQNSSASARWFTESREALLRKLKPLSSAYLNIQWNRLQKIAIENGRIYVFDVSSIPNVRVRKILSSLLIRSIVLKAQYNNITKPILIVVDEAHNIFHTGNPLSTLIAEVRKWSVGFIVITQAPSMLAPVVLKNTNTKIIHSLKSFSDIRAMISTAILRKEHKKIISALKPGEALLITPELREPVLIKISRF